MSECIWYYCQGFFFFLCLFFVFWKRVHFKMKPNTNKRGEYEYGRDVIQGKGTKVPCFPYSPNISWRLWFGSRKKERKKRRLVGERTHSTENWTTSSFGVHRYKEMQPGKKTKNKKKNTLCLTSQLRSTMQQWKVQSQQCDHSPKLTGWQKSVLWFARFSVRSQSLWFNKRVTKRKGRRKRSGESTTKTD